MTYLIIQIVLFLLVATFIGWLMGRSVAKNRERVVDDENRELKSKYASLEEFRDRMNKDYFAIKERDKQKTTELNLVKKQLTDTRVKGETYKLEHYDMKLKLEKLAGQQNNIDSKLESERHRFQSEQDSSQIKIKELMDRVSVLASEKRNSDTRITQLGKEREELTRRTQSASETQLQLNGKLRTLDTEREKMQDITQSLQNEIQGLNTRVSTLVDENQTLNNRVTELKQDKENTQSQARHANEELEDVTTQMIDIRNQRDDFHRKLRTISDLVEPVNSNG